MEHIILIYLFTLSIFDFTVVKCITERSCLMAAGKDPNNIITDDLDCSLIGDQDVPCIVKDQAGIQGRFGNVRDFYSTCLQDLSYFVVKDF